MGALQTYKNGASRELGKKSPDLVWEVLAQTGLGGAITHPVLRATAEQLQTHVLWFFFLRVQNNFLLPSVCNGDHFSNDCYRSLCTLQRFHNFLFLLFFGHVTRNV